MDTHSARDCYCKTGESSASRKDGVHSERSRGKVETKRVVSKTKLAKNKKKEACTPAKIVNEDSSHLKRSSGTPPLSPTLSPETSAALDDVEQFLKNVQIQIREINMVSNCGRVQKPVDVYQDETALEDETDQLLYIRERVAHKFQEANSWIDTDSGDFKHQDFLFEKAMSAKPRKPVDYSAPKFKTLEERCKEYNKYENLESQKLGFSLPISSIFKDNETNKRANEIYSQTRDPGNAKKIDTFSIQACPTVNIKGELVAQNLESIHIAPDPSFIQDTANIGTYMFCHNNCAKDMFPQRKEKFVKIVENDEKTKKCTQSVNSKRKKGGSNYVKEVKQSTDSTHSSTSQGNSVAEIGDTSLETDNKCTENVENQRKTADAVAICLENKEKSELILVNDENVKNENKNLENNVSEPLFNDISITKEEREAVKEETSDTPIKVIYGNKNIQKQVRFDEHILLDTKNQSNDIVSQIEDEPDPVMNQDLEVPSKSIELEIFQNAADGQQCQGSPTLKAVQGNCEYFLLSTDPIEENEKSSKELHEKEEYERQEHYREIDQRFTSILKKHYVQNKDFDTSNRFMTTNTDSSGSLEESESLFNLYNPPIDEFDNILDAYNKIIDNVAQSTKTFEKFLTRPEIIEYSAKNEIVVESKEPPSSTIYKTVETRNSNTSRYVQTKRTIEPKTKNSGPKERLPAVNKYANRGLHMHKAEPKTAKPMLTKTSSLIKKDNDLWKKCTISRNINKHSVRNDSNMKGRLNIVQKMPDNLYKKHEESSESDADRKIMKTDNLKQMYTGRKNVSRDPCSFQKESEASSFASSLNILSSGSDSMLQSSNHTNRLHPILKSSINNANTVVDESSYLKPSTTSPKEIEIKDLQKDVKNTTLHNSIYSDVLKQVLPELKDTSNTAEHLISCALQKEMDLIEDKIKSAFNMDQIIPLLVKNLLDNLQRDNCAIKGQNMELWIAQHVQGSNTVSTNIQEDVGNHETLSLRSDNEEKKQKSHTECLQIDPNLGATEMKKQNEKSLEDCCSYKTGEQHSTKSIHSSNNQLFNKENENTLNFTHKSCTSSEKHKSNSDIELLKEISNEKTDEMNTDKNIESIVSQSLKYSDIMEANVKNSTIQPSNFVDECGTNENEIVNATECEIEQDAKPNKSINDENICLDSVEKCAGVINSTHQDSTILGQNLLVLNSEISEAKTTKSFESQSNNHCEVKCTTPSNKSTNISSTDSLHNCESLPSSPRNVQEMLKDVKLSDVKIDRTKCPNTNDTLFNNTNELIPQNTSYCYNNTSEKEKILSELYDSVHKKLLFSTCSSTVGAIGQNYRLSNNIIATESNNIESSDSSRSEGEFCIQSSGSYSLGEVRMLKKELSEGENTDGFDNGIKNMISKKMLDSWTDSSKSLIKSIGEI